MLNKFFIFICLLTISNTAFSEEIKSPDTLSLKMRGASSEGSIAIIVSNRRPIYNIIVDTTTIFLRNDYRLALVPSDFDYDLTKITTSTSPFASEIKYVIKLINHTQNLSEKTIKVDIEVLRISDRKIVKSSYHGARVNVAFFAREIEDLLIQLFPKKNYLNPKIVSAKGSIFTFAQKDFPTLRKGDEIKVRYSEPRDGITESIAIVQNFSNHHVVAKDISSKVKSTDVVVRNAPRRNRFYLNIGAVVPFGGQRVLTAMHGTNVWQDTARWAGGFKVEGEYERFLPHQLVSTTAFGINIDRTMHTYLMTGVGYRFFMSPVWELVPYFRIGAAYTPVGLRGVGGSDSYLQGMALSLGMAFGLNFVRRFGDSLYVGADLGIQYYPYTYVSVMSGSEKIKPLWQHGDGFLDKFSMTQVFPYLSVKIGWIF